MSVTNHPVIPPGEPSGNAFLVQKRLHYFVESKPLDSKTSRAILKGDRQIMFQVLGPSIALTRSAHAALLAICSTRHDPRVGFIEAVDRWAELRGDSNTTKAARYNRSLRALMSYIKGDETDTIRLWLPFLKDMSNYNHYEAIWFCCAYGMSKSEDDSTSLSRAISLFLFGERKTPWLDEFFEWS